MRKTIAIILGLTIWSSLTMPTLAAAQRIAPLQALAHGKGTIIMNGNDKYEITAVLVILRENGEAEFTLYTQLQVAGQGRWSAGKDLSQGIDLTITSGVVKGSSGTGKLFLREDGKSIARLTMEGKSGSGNKYEVNFVADEKEKGQN